MRPTQAARSDAGTLLGTLFDALLETVFPTRCAGCELPGELLCGACRDALPLIDARTACPRCYAPYGWLVCTECWDADLGLDAAVAVGLLERPLSRAVTLYKDAFERRLAEVLGEMLAEAVVARWSPGAPDPHLIAEAIVPVPASMRAVRRRGYDHALLLAESVSRHTGVPCEPLLRHVRSADQRHLSRAERLSNVTDAFEVASDTGRVLDRVLIIDDVLTTGATMKAAATALARTRALPR